MTRRRLVNDKSYSKDLRTTKTSLASSGFVENVQVDVLRSNKNELKNTKRRNKYLY